MLLTPRLKKFKANFTTTKQEEKPMNKDTMKKEIERIFGVALKARREAARMGRMG